ncbi:hypothetical protein A5880_000042 [Enterococcus sp. 4G2_DIV0659]|uniref:Uncharacterized protein n=1 Tax=Candidatus Enterococcus mansonii TaxID=1834181 RepID=A0A242CKZ2_9ENTE|nr:hypothetical protein A5880_001136 [Enterococcus sp. 4G2_DIV0659]
MFPLESKVENNLHLISEEITSDPIVYQDSK